MTHHPTDDLLAAYAAGATDDGEELVIATHLALCPACRDRAASFEAIGGALIAAAQPPAEPPSAAGDLDAVLARLDDPEPEPDRKPMPPAGKDDLPMPLRGHTGPLADVPFRRVAPGIWRFDLAELSRPDRPVALISLRPGLRVPDHRHSATERGLVLRGGFTDESGHYVRGDLAIRGPDDEHAHQQRIDDGERCVVLMVDDGPKIPTTWWGRLVNFLFGT